MLTRSGSAASLLVVTSRNGQFGGSRCALGATVTTATTNLNSQLSDIQLEMLVAGKRTDEIVLQHNNNKAAVLDLSSRESGIPSPSCQHRRSSSCRSVPSYLSGSLPGSHKEQVRARLTQRLSYYRLPSSANLFEIGRLSPIGLYDRCVRISCCKKVDHYNTTSEMDLFRKQTNKPNDRSLPLFPASDWVNSSVLSAGTLPVSVSPVHSSTI